MPTFEYSAKSESGETVRGVVDSLDEADLARRLTAQQLYLIQCKLTKSVAHSGAAIKVTDLIEFTEQLRMLVEAGLPLVKGLEVLEDESPPDLRATIRDIRMRLMGGSTFGEGLAAHPRVFPEIYVSVVRSGEAAGTFDIALREAGRFIEAREAMKKSVRDATLYPVILLSATIGVVILLTTVVFPKILGMVANMKVELSVPTKIIMALSYVIKNFGLPLIGFTVVATIAYKIACRKPASRVFFDKLKLKIPFFGELIVRLELARFARAAGPMFAAGVDLLRVIGAGATTIQNQALRAGLQRAQSRIESGRLLSEALNELHIFPRLFMTLLRVGESTGTLDVTFERTATIYDREVQTRIKKAMAVFQPAVLLFLGGVVIITALALFMTVQTIMRQATVQG